MFRIEVVPAYNINKEFHPKSDGNVGYISIINNKRIYHAGDTDMIPEMKVTLPDIALITVSGTYVMTAEEILPLSMNLLSQVSLQYLCIMVPSLETRTMQRDSANSLMSVK